MSQCWLFPPMFRALRRQYSSRITSRHYTSATLPTLFSLDRGENSSSVVHTNLRRLLASTESAPNNVWDSYNNALTMGGPSEIDLSMHQSVLRRCTFSAAEMRRKHKKRYLSLARETPGHMHELRFQNVIRNILSMGCQPSRADYHFVLVHFAAVGHSIGSMNVYEEMKSTSGCQPNSVTITLVLQSIAHRLVVPERKADRWETLNRARRLLKQILDDMQKIGMPWTAANMDLTIRIMKHTSDQENFDTLLRLGYGVDLRYPDRPALDAEANTLLPFTIHTLNTVVDMYGKSGNVSKLVQAFEVLTVPLPHAQKHFVGTSFDDDDDFGVSPPDSATPFQFPFTEPNTTTFTFLLRHLSAQNKAHLARHYLLQAIELDKQGSNQLRRKSVVTPNILDVRSPRMAVNRAMFLSVFSISNRNKNIPLMRWVYTRLPSVIRRKKEDVVHYSNFIKHLERVGKWPPPSSKPSKVEVSSGDTDSEFIEIDGVRWRRDDIDDVLEVDPSRQQSFAPSAPKPLNLRLHLRVLKADIEDLTTFQSYVRSVLARTVERVKDKLGRRIWRGQDVYLKSMATAKNHGVKERRQVSRESWKQTVNYKPRLPTGFARPPSHFHHRVIRQQYWQDVKSAQEAKAKRVVARMPRLSSSPPVDAKPEGSSEPGSS